VICITGAGGSIGSELATQCSKFGAKKIILLDHSEFNLYQIEQELNNFNIVPILVSVVDRKSLDQVFSKYSPNIVIHAAAYKHVPMVELNIAQSIVNNIVGTKNVIDVSIDNHIENIIVVSTDKAVRPTSIMGATKRVCELYAQNVNSGKTRISVVRFGNVLGSSGSVIPLFKKQIKMGGPITITHPDITRYFMLISEACELVLQSGSIGKGGEVFVLNMGEPIKITDLAQTMVKLSGVNNIEFKYTGLRPGEKLHEELLHCDSDIITKYESITISASEEVPIDYLNNQIDNLLNSKSQARDLKKIVPEFNHQLN
jgi:FlaA1/EpsC-like NDP-sugar epimerase